MEKKRFTLSGGFVPKVDETENPLRPSQTVQLIHQAHSDPTVSYSTLVSASPSSVLPRNKVSKENRTGI